MKIMRFYHCMKQMSNSRLTKQIFLYDQYFIYFNNTLTTWSQEIQNIIAKHDLHQVIDRFTPKPVLKLLHDLLHTSDISRLKTECWRSNKLRTSNTLFSPFIPHSDIVSYTLLYMPFVPTLTWMFATPN